MKEQIRAAKELIDFIYESPSAFHSVEKTKEMLLKESFCELKEEEKWELKKGGKYFTTKNGTALIAFTVGEGEIEKEGFRIVGAHTDSPTFRIKPSPEIVAEEAYLKLNTEVYGGPILSTWFDRPLSLAGRVALANKNPLKPEIKLVNIKKPIMIIPNLAIHMNRSVNSGVEINKQKDVLPLVTIINEKMEKENYLLKLVAKELSVNLEDILDFDLYLYEFEKGSIIGANDEFISVGKLDDLSMVFAGIKALISANGKTTVNVMACFDNEEVGSTTKQGADSPLLSSVLERISISLGKGREEYFRALANSFIISCDLAHAAHPNYGEKADPINRPIINKGPVIKVSASQSYTTDAFSGAVYEGICKKLNIPVQRFVNRSDERGGSTIGPISAAHININSVDMGIAVLAMHSVRELGGVEDLYYSIKSFEEFYKL